MRHSESEPTVEMVRYLLGPRVVNVPPRATVLHGIQFFRPQVVPGVFFTWYTGANKQRLFDQLIGSH